MTHMGFGLAMAKNIPLQLKMFLKYRLKTSLSSVRTKGRPTQIGQIFSTVNNILGENYHNLLLLFQVSTLLTKLLKKTPTPQFMFTAKLVGQDQPHWLDVI